MLYTRSYSKTLLIICFPLFKFLTAPFNHKVNLLLFCSYMFLKYNTELLIGDKVPIDNDDVTLEYSSLINKVNNIILFNIVPEIFIQIYIRWKKNSNNKQILSKQSKNLLKFMHGEHLLTLLFLNFHQKVKYK